MATNSDRRKASGNGEGRSSQQHYRVYNGARCFCKMRAVIRVSSTETNPRRLFYGCLNLRVSDRYGFFLWADNDTGAEDTYNMNEATSGMKTSSTEDEQWRRNVIEKLHNLEVGIRKLFLLVFYVFSVLFTTIIFLVGCSIKN
ncbi:Zinc finger, GRF-type [Sesbania bispinosa]|nr:Zinc finger, GRF-type [Sesbania bispinosa]KAJ1377559.1 Zinc finger, GRF-type [Sesbania bispinosa]